MIETGAAVLVFFVSLVLWAKFSEKVMGRFMAFLTGIVVGMMTGMLAFVAIAQCLHPVNYP